MSNPFHPDRLPKENIEELGLTVAQAAEKLRCLRKAGQEGIDRGDAGALDFFALKKEARARFDASKSVNAWVWTFIMTFNRIIEAITGLFSFSGALMATAQVKSMLLRGRHT